MTRIEYDLLAAARPELKLPGWHILDNFSRRRLEGHTRETLIAWRVAQCLEDDSPKVVFSRYSGYLSFSREHLDLPR